MQQRKPIVVAPTEGRKITVLGQEITVKLTSKETGGDYYMFEAVIAPGGQVPIHTHSREDETLEVLEGELELFLGDTGLRACTGSTAFFPRSVAHGFRNPTQKPTRLRFVVSPGLNFETFFEELSSLPVDQPPDFVRVSEIFERYGLPLADH